MNRIMSQNQLKRELHGDKSFAPRLGSAVLFDVRSLIDMHRSGILGGGTMPEDVHPKLDRSSRELAHYFTLGMALNYQRNSYSLWRSCTNAWDDEVTRWIYYPEAVVARSVDELREALFRYRVALQPNNHVKIWYTICRSLTGSYLADVQQLFRTNEGKISEIKAAIAREKKGFPYLAGPKICNYWLYVMMSYTENGLCEKHALNVAPDTHVINASSKLGVISEAEAAHPSAQGVVIERWTQLLDGTDLDPIDIHTPLWLWSRSGFPPLKSNSIHA